jgi:glycosyltransferase involved in cell wall biosynthesis
VRVLFLAHSFPRYADDLAGSFLLRLAVALQASGVEVRVLAPAAPGLASEETIGGVVVRRYRYAPSSWETLAYTGAMADEARGSFRGLAALGGLVLAGARAVRREVRAWRPDVVHAHWWFPAGLSATLPGALRGRPLVVTMHGSDVRLALGVAPARALFARVARRAAAVTSVSRWLREQAAQMAPGLASEVAPMPVATDDFVQPAPDGLRDGLLFVGRLTVQKGVDVLLQALARARTEVSLTVVGGGPEERALRALATQLGLDARVRWLGSQPQSRLAALYGGARALVVPSREEGLGLVAVEAHLCGTPVIAFASGGLVDVVQHDHDGLLVAPGDVDALAAAIDRMQEEPTLSGRLGAAGRTTALTRFAPDAVAARYRALYARALAA